MVKTRRRSRNSSQYRIQLRRTAHRYRGQMIGGAGEKRPSVIAIMKVIDESKEDDKKVWEAVKDFYEKRFEDRTADFWESYILEMKMGDEEIYEVSPDYTKYFNELYRFYSYFAKIRRKKANNNSNRGFFSRFKNTVEDKRKKLNKMCNSLNELIILIQK
jgi:tRNA-dihydrouridine synthase